MQVNIEDLQKAFALSLNPSQIHVNEATQYLRQASEAKSYIPCLLKILVDPKGELNIRQAAAVQLNRLVQDKWSEKTSIDVEDRETLKNNILEAIILVADIKKLYSQLQGCIYKIAIYDFPHSWGDLFPALIAHLKKQDNPQITYGTLLAIQSLLKAFEFQLGDPRKPLIEIVENSFNLIEEILEQSLGNYSLPIAAEIIRLILKIVFTVVNLDVPLYFKANSANLKKWMVAMAKICDSEVPADAQTPVKTCDELIKREKNVYWVNKKWCGEIMIRFMQKFGNKDTTNLENKEYAPSIKTDYLVPFLEIFVKNLLKRKTHFIANKYSFYAGKYIFYSLKIPEFREMLNEHLEELLFDVFLPMVRLSLIDLQNWKTDQVEFVHSQEDFSHVARDIKHQGIDNVTEICRHTAPDKIHYLYKFMVFAFSVIDQGINPRTNEKADDLLLEAIFTCIEMLADQIKKFSEINEKMEGFLEKYVIPNFNNQNGLFRAAACKLFGSYGQIQFKNPQNLLLATDGIYRCLTDKELPVRVYAASSLQFMVSHKVSAETLKPYVRDVIKIFLKIMEEIDQEGVINSLQEIIVTYKAEVTPFALELLAKLGETFFSYVTSINEEHEDESKLAAEECLYAARKLLTLNLNSEVYVKALDILAPIFDFTLTPKGSSYTDVASELLTEYLYSLDEIPTRLWRHFILLNYMHSGYPSDVSHIYDSPDEIAQHTNPKDIDWGSEHLDLHIGALQNFISKGKSVFVQERDPGTGLLLIDLLIKTIDTTYEINKKGLASKDEVYYMSTLYFCIIESCPGMINNTLIPIIQRCLLILKMESVQKKKRLRRVLTQTLAISIWYNPAEVVALFIKENVLDGVLQAIISISSSLRSELEIKRVILGLASIFKLNPYELPQSVREMLPKILTNLIDLSEKSLSARGEEAEGEADQNDEAEEVEDEDSDDEDYQWGDATEKHYESQLSELCDVLYFKSCIQTMGQNHPNEFKEILNSLTIEQQMKFKNNFAKAEMQRAKRG